MTKTEKLLGLGILIAIVIAIVSGIMAHSAITEATTAIEHVDATFGGITTGTNFKYGISVGNTSALGAVPTNIAKLLAGRGAIIGNVSQTASTTAAYDIAVTGVVSGDLVYVEQATSTAATGLPFVVIGAGASTTPGFITLTVLNMGPSAVVPNNIASSTQYEVIGTQ